MGVIHTENAKRIQDEAQAAKFEHMKKVFSRLAKRSGGEAASTDNKEENDYAQFSAEFGQVEVYGENLKKLKEAINEADVLSFTPVSKQNVIISGRVNNIRKDVQETE